MNREPCGRKRASADGKCCLLHEPRIHGFIQAMLLLLLQEESRHGYDLAKLLEDELPSETVPDAAVIYRMLRELEIGGYTESHLVPGQGGPARKVYSLTPAGRELLGDWRKIIVERIAMLSKFLDRYEGKQESRGVQPE
ncbi:MAG: PadR family transcriptional regulator [Spirochaetales bacterium]|nr:PadR family transcriptional regulator [Spirochaetales bacterium]